MTEGPRGAHGASTESGTLSDQDLTCKTMDRQLPLQVRAPHPLSQMLCQNTTGQEGGLKPCCVMGGTPPTCLHLHRNSIYWCLPRCQQATNILPTSNGGWVVHVARFIEVDTQLVNALPSSASRSGRGSKQVSDSETDATSVGNGQAGQ